MQDAKPAASQTEDILNSILPREFEDASALWLQTVSSQPATRLDVIHLQETLDRQLQKRQARETGICPVREELYAQCFDELIRQTTVNCAERGLLLLRVRDEMRMSIMAYQTLYESAVAFGMRKALSTEQGKAEMEATIATQKETIATLERRVAGVEAEVRSEREARGGGEGEDGEGGRGEDQDARDPGEPGEPGAQEFPEGRRGGEEVRGETQVCVFSKNPSAFETKRATLRDLRSGAHAPRDRLVAVSRHGF